LAERNEDTGLVMVGCQSLGIVSLFLGKPAEAAASLRNGIGLYRSNQDRSLGYRYGVDPGANCLILYALSQWLLGYPDQARQRISEAESLIATIEHPLTTALTRSWIARINAMFAAPEAALSAAEATIAYSREQNIRLCEAEGSIVRGWARVATGASGDIGALEDGIAMWRATGAQVVEPFYLFLLADAHLYLKDHAAATVAIDAAQTAVQTRGERWWAPEILRLKAEVLRARGDNGGADRQLVETSLTAALDLASSQKARLLELRAAVGLARFRKEAGLTRDGHDLLRQRFDSFSEGFATEDLMTAERLLRELA